MFTCLLPPLPEDSRFLDVGSRFGPVLFAAHLFTKVKRITGVEMNEDHCKIAKEAVDTLKMGDRIRYVGYEVAIYFMLSCNLYFSVLYALTSPRCLSSCPLPT